MNELIERVEQWSTEKDLHLADPAKQYLKVAEECGEIAAALARNDMPELTDAIGDTLVTLIILCQQVNLSPESCLQVALQEIEGRTGKTVNGLFVKDSDLKSSGLTQYAIKYENYSGKEKTDYITAESKEAALEQAANIQGLAVLNDVELVVAANEQ